MHVNAADCIHPAVAAFTTGPELLDFRTNLGDDANYIYGVSWWMPQMKYSLIFLKGVSPNSVT